MGTDKLWRLASILGQGFTILIVLGILCAVIAYFQSRKLLEQARSVILDGSQGPGEVHYKSRVAACAGAPTPLQALCTPGGTQFMAFSRYEAHVLLHEMYHGSTDSRLQDCGMDSLLDGNRPHAKPYIVDVSSSCH